MQLWQSFDNKELKRNITKAVRIVKVITTSHSINTCKCRSCGRDGIKPKTDLPNNSSYDSSITTEVADDYVCRMPFRMIADRMRRHGITLSSGTVHNIMRRRGTSLRTPAALLQSRYAWQRYCIVFGLKIRTKSPSSLKFELHVQKQDNQLRY